MNLKYFFILFFSFIGFYVVSAVVERSYFIHFGSLLPVKQSSYFKSIEEISDYCKQSTGEVLMIVKRDNGIVQARCGGLIPNTEIFDITQQMK